ncbi:MAG: HAMP domain-containing protein [Proteobacteria bacterium]|nr:HAMP domain-containing protein [Pseudomonadota bacterium]
MLGKSLSIKRKLTMMVMGVSLMAVVLTVVAIGSYLIYDIRRSKQHELEVSAATAADRNSAALTFLDTGRAQANLDIFRLSPSILSACIYDASGDLFAAYEAPHPSAVACQPRVEETKEEEIRMGSDKLAAFQPIRRDEQVLGSVFLLSDTHEIDTYIRKILQISTNAALAVLAAALLVTMYIQRGISGPLLQLAAIARQITQNRDFSLQAPVMQHDEIGEVATAFNGMLAEVRQRGQELMYANETLEHKVLLRTRQLEEAKRVAEQANEAKSEFLRNISHEFRTPLHAMISFSSYGIKEAGEAGPDELRRYFQIILKSSERLTRLVNEVLDLARFEHGEQVFAMERADIHELVQRAVESLKSLAQEKQITVECEREGDMRLVCDHDRTTQVITNLLSNAIKFSPNASLILIRCQRGQDSISVACRDEGVGIPDYEKEQIFEPFRQSSQTNTGAGGTGLGLAICRGIVGAHGGRIWAENNTDGPGATVTFTIPCNVQEGRKRISLQSEERHENAA